MVRPTIWTFCDDTWMHFTKIQQLSVNKVEKARLSTWYYKSKTTGQTNK